MSDFISRMKDFFDKSVEVSKDALSKAGDKVQDFGDKSVTRIEITHLESQVKKQMQSLGLHVYEKFAVEKLKTVKADTETVKNILDEIAKLKQDIEDRERKLIIS